MRVPLHGRRVRGWVIAPDVVPDVEPDRLCELLAVVSAGPPADVVELCRWAAWRWAGPLARFLRVASPPNIVSPEASLELATAHYPRPPSPLDGRLPERAAIAWPPAAPALPLFRSLLAEEGSTLVVTPAPAARVDRLRKALEADGRHVVVLRGDQPAAERTAAWDQCRRGACVVLGGRVVAFAPVPDLRAGVVLDEPDEALTEERAPTWNARDVVRERAQRTSATLALVAPVPSVDAVAAVGEPVRPDRRVERDGWPRVEMVDLRSEPPGIGVLSTAFATALHATLAAGRRAVAVVNRRGRARLLVCITCGAIARCEVCGAAMSEDGPDLACRRCGAVRPRVCTACGSGRLAGRRPGVARLREEIAGLVPRVEVVDVDASSAELQDAPVYVGTEAVLHRVPRDHRTGLVAFLEFDQELLAPRYRAAEQALWLLVRGARLLGPRRDGGRLLVQTRMPDHEVLTSANRGDPTLALAAERARREATGFPPFGGLAELSGDAPAVERACDELIGRAGISVLGPSAGRALVRAPTVAALCDALAAVDFTAARGFGRLRVSVDPLRV